MRHTYAPLQMMILYEQPQTQFYFLNPLLMDVYVNRSCMKIAEVRIYVTLRMEENEFQK